jgi:hypothetical protein
MSLQSRLLPNFFPLSLQSNDSGKDFPCKPYHVNYSDIVTTPLPPLKKKKIKKKKKKKKKKNPLIETHSSAYN